MAKKCPFWKGSAAAADVIESSPLEVAFNRRLLYRDEDSPKILSPLG